MEVLLVSWRPPIVGQYNAMNDTLRLMRLSPLFLALALPVFGADPPGFQMWSGSDLLARANALSLNQYHQGVDRMENWGNHAVILERLEGTTPGEIHENTADLFVITSGETDLIIGGTVVEAATTAPGEIRGKTINGGTVKKLKAGDVVHIPAKLPHMVSVAPGGKCTYLVFKVRVE